MSVNNNNNDNDNDTETLFIPMQNDIEKSMREVPIDYNNGDPALMELALAMRDKNAIVEKYLSDDALKTEVTKTERQMLPLIFLLAEEPFYSTKEFYRKFKTLEEYELIKGNLKINELETWGLQFLKYGLCQDRQGRIEDKEVIGSLFSQDMDIRNGVGNNGTNPINKV